MKYVNKTTADELTWLDEKGNPPRTDSEGRLTKPFTLIVTYDSTARVERITYGVGAVLPQTPAAFEKWKADVRAKADKEVAEEDAAITARMAVDTAERNAIVEVERERRAHREQKLQARAAETDTAAVQGDEDVSAIGTKIAARTAAEKSEGVTELPSGSDAAREPYTKEKQVGKRGKAKKAPARNVHAARPNSAAGQKRAGTPKAAAKTNGAKTNGNGVKGSEAHLRHARDGKWVLVKDLTKFGPENRVVQNRFASEQSALDYAKEHGIKVIGNGK